VRDDKVDVEILKGSVKDPNEEKERENKRLIIQAK
jgi:hypothetical protein